MTISAEARPRQNVTVKSYPVGDELVLYFPNREQAYSINRSARAIWNLCDGRHSLQDISARLSQPLDLPSEALLPDVTGVVDQLAQLGLLTGLAAAKAVALPPPTLMIAFNGRQVAISAAPPEVQSGLTAIFAQMLIPPAEKTAEQQFAITGDEGQYRLRRENGAEQSYTTLPRLLAALSHELMLSFIKLQPHLVWLHAGAVAHRGGAILIPGLTGQGKSTLVTQLYQQGWAYLADDLLALEPDTNRAIPFPRTPYVRLAPGRPLSPIQFRKLEKTKIELDPNRVCRQPQPIQAIVLPAYDAVTPAELVPCPPAEAVQVLLENCANFPDQRDTAVEHLCRLAEQLPLFRLSFHNGEQAAERLIRVAHEWAASP